MAEKQISNADPAGEIDAVESTNNSDPGIGKSDVGRILPSQIWFGYSRGGQYFLDLAQSAGPTEERLRSVREHWQLHVPRPYRMAQKVLLCRRPIIAIGVLPTALKLSTQKRMLPRQIQLQSLEKNDLLTCGFYNPKFLADDLDYFDHNSSFQDVDDSDASTPRRRIVVIHWEVDKRLIAYPFFGSLLLGAMIAVAVAVGTKSVSTGAQIGECICGIIASVFCYVIWRCS